MSEKRKYLGKKRRKIFAIEKELFQETPKNILIEKENISSNDDNIITIEEIPAIKSSEKNLNLSEINEKNNLKTQKHSLINISNLVYDFIKKEVNTTSNEVTTYIKNIIQSYNNPPNQKNIQRRVYDAINVISAIGLIKKDKQKIKFINYKNNSIECINNINEEKEEEKNDETEEKINELENKRNQLIQNYLTLKFYEKFNKLNKNNPLRTYENKLEFPFDLIIYNKASSFHMQSKDDSSRYLLLSNSEFVHLTPYEIIKKLISYDIFLKLNENNLNNLSNSKKSTNENSLIEKGGNFNTIIDNDSLLKNKCIESPDKNKLFLKNSILLDNYSQQNYSTRRETSTKKSKDEKEEDFIFEYLRNIKYFVDEIINNCNFSKKMDNSFENINNDDNNELPEEQEKIFEEKNSNIFTWKKMRKNSNISNWSNFNEYNENNKNDDSISEISYFIQNFK